jgi:hypothetical protein
MTRAALKRVILPIEQVGVPLITTDRGSHGLRRSPR